MAITNDDVQYGYRYVLGRPPESEQIVEHYSKLFKDIASFRLHLLQSVEFKARNAAFAYKSCLVHTPPSEIETVLDQHTFEKVLAKTASYWSAVGTIAPNWPVLSYEKYAPDMLPQNLDEFYWTGIEDFRLIRDQLRRMNRSPADFNCILEFGCGAGRATAQLAKNFKHVIALDIPGSQIERAREHVHASGARNVEFIQVLPYDIMPGRGYDLWYSKPVLQHNPPPVTLGILAKAFFGLQSGGVAIIHVRTHEDGYQFRVADYLEYGSSDMEMHSTPQRAILELADQSGCRLIELHEEPGHSTNVTNIFVFEKR